MRTSNPALSPKLFRQVSQTLDRDQVMTTSGTVNKTLILVALAMIGAIWVWNHLAAVPVKELGAAAMPWVLGGAIGGFVLALITIFKQSVAAYTSPLYALVEGLFLGAISLIFEVQFPGIVLQAVGLTFGVALVMLGVYRSGLIKVTPGLRMGIIMATGGIAIVYVLSMVLGIFGVNMPLIHSAGPMGILFSLFVVGVASFNLLLDFDFIERGAQSGLPKYMEWYGAFGLIVTLVWLYLEILRLLSKLQRR